MSEVDILAFEVTTVVDVTAFEVATVVKVSAFEVTTVVDVSAFVVTFVHGGQCLFDYNMVIYLDQILSPQSRPRGAPHYSPLATN